MFKTVWNAAFLRKFTQNFQHQHTATTHFIHRFNVHFLRSYTFPLRLPLQILYLSLLKPKKLTQEIPTAARALIYKFRGRNFTIG